MTDLQYTVLRKVRDNQPCPDELFTGNELAHPEHLCQRALGALDAGEDAHCHDLTGGHRAAGT